MSGWVLISGRDDVFDALAENRQVLFDAEIRELALIAQACDEYTVDPSRADAAAEKLIQGGADGTALVGEFLDLELGGLLQISHAAAVARIRETLDLRDRHPELWAHTIDGRLRPYQAVKVAARCSNAGLPAEAARWVDHQLGLGLAALPWPRVARTLEGLIVKADPELAAQRARLQRERRAVWIGDHRDGGSELYARLDSEDALALDETLTDLSTALAAAGNSETPDHRRATALGVLADPRAALDLLTGHGDGRPTNRRAELVVHIAAETVYPDDWSVADPAPNVARLDGVGALHPGTLKRFLGHSHVTIRPVVDLYATPPVDAYEVPARMRQHVLARQPVEAFPFSALPATGLDLDHTVPYNPLAPPGAGQTRPDNLAPLGRRTHRAKTARRWRLEQPEPGVLRWTSPHGFRYEVTPHGTTALGRARREGSLAS